MLKTVVVIIAHVMVPSYDVYGRIRKGPAPLNIEVADDNINDGLLVVGYLMLFI